MKKIPKFKTDEEAARFRETHSFEDYHKDAKDAEVKFARKPKKTIAIRLDPDDVRSVAQIAESKGLSYTSLIGMWVKEYPAKEAKHIT